MYPLFDSHIHLDQYPAESLDRLVEEWQQQGVERVLAVSTNLASSYRTLELRQRHPHFIFAALGYHPEQLPPAQQEFKELCALIQQEKGHISAVGEIGLPHYRYQDPSSLTPSLEIYMEVLRQFVSLAKRLELPVVLHAVHDKAKIGLSILQEYQITQAHFHWLKAPIDVTQEIIDSGYYISVTPEICYRERDQQLTKQIPLSQLLLETDGPWRFGGPFEDQRTTPLLIKEVAKQASLLKGVDEEELLHCCNENVKRLLFPAAF